MLNRHGFHHLTSPHHHLTITTINHSSTSPSPSPSPSHQYITMCTGWLTKPWWNVLERRDPQHRSTLIWPKCMRYVPFACKIQHCLFDDFLRAQSALCFHTEIFPFCSSFGSNCS